MKKSYLKEFQGDIGWVILIFSFKLEVFWRYGSKTKKFSLKLCKWDSISVKNWYIYWKLDILAWRHQSVLHYSEKLVFFMIFVENLIFQWNTLNGTALQWKLLVFTKNLKIHNISVKHTERYSIQVKNLIFFSNFSKISKFPVIWSNSTALQWKNWYFSVISWILHETVKIDNFLWRYTNWYCIWLKKLIFFLK